MSEPRVLATADVAAIINTAKLDCGKSRGYATLGELAAMQDRLDALYVSHEQLRDEQIADERTARELDREWERLDDALGVDDDNIDPHVTAHRAIHTIQEARAVISDALANNLIPIATPLYLRALTFLRSETAPTVPS